MVIDADSLLKDTVTLDSLREKFIEENTNANIIKDRVLETKSEILPIRSLMNEFTTTMATLETMNHKTSQEKFLAVRVKLLELHNKIQKISKDLHTIQPLINTMQKFNEENLDAEKKYFVTETLGISHSFATIAAKSSPKKSSVAKATPVRAPTPTTQQQAVARANMTKKNPTPAAMPTPNLKQIPVTQTAQAQANLIPGVSPMAMASPMNNMSPHRKPNQLVGQTRDNLPYPGSTPSNSLITPQNILNMTSLDMNQNQTPRLPDNPTNSIDLTNLDLDNLNMDFLN